MAKLRWNKIGERLWQTGVSKGVLYLQDKEGKYPNGVVWNGLSSVSESPSGAEPTVIYADNIAYLRIISAEDFDFTIEAFMSPKEFDVCDGTITNEGVSIHQQKRAIFGMTYQTIKGNDTDGIDHGYLIHLLYGCIAQPSEANHETIDDSSDILAYSWECTTDPVEVPGFGKSAYICIDSTQIDPKMLIYLETILYGTPYSNARLPLPDELIDILGITPPNPFSIPAPRFIPPSGEFELGVTVRIESDYQIFISNSPNPATFTRYMNQIITITTDTIFYAYAFNPETLEISNMAIGNYIIAPIQVVDAVIKGNARLKDVLTVISKKELIIEITDNVVFGATIADEYDSIIIKGG